MSGATTQPMNLTYNVTHAVLAALYLVLLGLAIYLLVRLPRRDGSKPRPQMWFYLFFIGAAVGRIAWFALQPMIAIAAIRCPQSVDFFLNTFPSFFFFTGFLVVLFLWAEVYHNESNRFDFNLVRLKIPLIVINLLMYTFLCVMYALDFTLGAPWGSLHQIIDPARYSPPYAEVIILYQVEVMFVSVFIGYVLYGILILRKMSRFTAQQRGQNAFRRIAYITGLNAICFLARATITLWADIVQTNVYNKTSWIDFVYYTVLELIPLCGLMLLLRTKEKRPPSSPPPPRDVFAPSYHAAGVSPPHSEQSPLLSRV